MRISLLYLACQIKVGNGIMTTHRNKEVHGIFMANSESSHMGDSKIDKKI
jgi:hypothetical protein